jgi:hypothetical protein
LRGLRKLRDVEIKSRGEDTRRYSEEEVGTGQKEMPLPAYPGDTLKTMA